MKQGYSVTREYTDDEFSFPDCDDQLFDGKWNPYTSADLTWSDDKWRWYTSSYKDAADVLVKHVQETKCCPDIYVFPIAFLYRHFLELSIKSIIRRVNVESYITFTHSLHDLWKECEKGLLGLFPEEGEDAFREAGRLLCEFDAIDRKSEAFRYPEDKNGNKYIQSIQTIDLGNVKNVIQKMDNLFCAITARLVEKIT